MEPFVSNDFKAGWLRGFFDGEGSAIIRTMQGGKKHSTYCLSVTNTDFDLMDTCIQYLSDLGIESREWNVRRRRNRKPARTLHISRAASILIFAQYVGFRAPEKSRKLKLIIEWITRPTINEQRAPEVLQMWNEGHSLRCISTKLGLRPGQHGRLRLAIQDLGATVPPFGRGRKRCLC